VAQIGLLVMAHHQPHLLGHHRPDHVENLVTVGAGQVETAGGLCDLRWIPLPYLAGDHLMDRQMEVRVHHLPCHNDLVQPRVEGFGELEMLTPDEKTPVVGVSRVQNSEVDPIHHPSVGGKAHARRSSTVQVTPTAYSPGPVHR
jgi:hypothetical protein